MCKIHAALPVIEHTLICSISYKKNHMLYHQEISDLTKVFIHVSYITKENKCFFRTNEQQQE